MPKTIMLIHGAWLNAHSWETATLSPRPGKSTGTVWSQPQARSAGTTPIAHLCCSLAAASTSLPRPS